LSSLYKEDKQIIRGELDSMESIVTINTSLTNLYEILSVSENIMDLTEFKPEEFIVIAPLTNEGNAVKAAERLRTAVSAIITETKNGSFSFTISLGISTFIKGDSYTTFNERADIALYKSKESGRNCSTVC